MKTVLLIYMQKIGGDVMRKTRIMCGISQYGVLNEMLKQMSVGFKEYFEDIEIYDLSVDGENDKFSKIFLLKMIATTSVYNIYLADLQIIEETV